MTVPASSRAALARCVGGDVERFLDEDWGRRARLWSGAEQPGFDDLLTLDEVDRVLTTSGLRTPQVRLVRGGRGVPQESFTRTALIGGARADGLIDPGKVVRAFEDGATVVLQSLQRWWPPVARFCRDMEVGLTHPVQANAYVTPPGAAGLSPHHDTHDVFVLQVHGSKQWLVREPLIEAPLTRHRSTPEQAGDRPLLFEAELAPGDALYLPRGFVHSATAQRGVSLHLTIGVLAVTGYDVVRHVAKAAADVPGLRNALPPGWAENPAVAADAVTVVLQTFARWVGSVDAAQVSDELGRGFWSHRRPLLDGQFLQLEQLDGIDENTILRVRPGVVCRPFVNGDRLELLLGDRSVSLPASLDAAVARLLDGPVRVAELADVMDAPSRLVLARRLVREGLLVIDASPARSGPTAW